jgi:putative transposase
MPRHSRRLAVSGIYHVMIRGNERKNIFMDDEDRLRFIDTVKEKKKTGEYFLYSYCLMDNHVHLVLRENKDGLHRCVFRNIRTAIPELSGQ